ncbi:3'-5' exonuclease [Enterovirga aerilata]|uniref:3'-5' exonuclease n=1 Tax=Enterovirga aerilata TaxID=2730920 RepID=A0A849IDV4_9HYPH|nr:3'-5' exonuclease [Enterovirga sp. DB1703]NNM74210.1 3'-5' exonuclease [Enterovirga sp. DB1703]
MHHAPITELAGRTWQTPRPVPVSSRPDKLLCVDIETVPDQALVPADWGDGLPKPFWNRVVCVSFVEARIARPVADGPESYTVERVASGGDIGWDEARILAGFWRLLERGNYRVATWNGRTFDMPVLRCRAFVHGIQTAVWNKRGGRWDGYSHRYSDEYHADVMDLLSAHGAAARMRLDEAAKAIGLPGKVGDNGAMVADLYENGELPRIRAYCETDTIQTFYLYARWALLSGRTDGAGYEASVASLTRYLEAERETRPHLGDFLDAWRKFH